MDDAGGAVKSYKVLPYINPCIWNQYTDALIFNIKERIFFCYNECISFVHIQEC